MTTLPEMPCRELVEVITDYLEHRLPAEDRARFEAHLGECPPCTEYMAQFRATIALAGHLDPEDVPEDALAPLRDAFRDWRT
jgi:anti-sigma factor RsiW